MKLTPFALLGLVALVALTACSSAHEEADDRESVTAASALAAQDWSLPTVGSNDSAYSVATAFLGTTAYVVFAPTANDVYFARIADSGAWSAPTRIASTTTSHGVALAAYRGFLYMLTEGPEGTNSVRMSRFDPTTQLWSAPSQLPMSSIDIPALAVHDDRLYVVGTAHSSPGYQMWMTSMDATGAFSVAVTTPFRGTSPALASYGGRLHLAYDHYASSTDFGDVQHASFDGTSWSAAAKIPTGFGTNVLRGRPALSRYVGGNKAMRTDCLHLAVSNAVGSNPLWWTYRCSASAPFAVPVTIPSSEGAREVALAASSARLRVVYPTIGRVMTQSYSYPSPFAPPPLLLAR